MRKEALFYSIRGYKEAEIYTADLSPGNGRVLKFLYFLRVAIVGLSVILEASLAQFALADVTWRSGHPPKIISAVIDDQRRLVITFNADDGLAINGGLYMDNDPINATPVSSSPTYGPIMYCNNKSSCLGQWPVPADLGSGPYTFKTEPLDPGRFPAGKYYLQVDTHNEDPHASTRQEEFSEITILVVETVVKPTPKSVPLLDSMKLPLNSGTALCVAWRDHLLLGNRVVQALNAYNSRMNAALAKIQTMTPAMDAIYQRALKQSADIKKALAADLVRANSACSAAPSIVAENGEFVPVPIPSSNGAQACETSRAHMVYVNQELLKIVNNLKTTQRAQKTRVQQLETRFNQFTADLKKSWPVLFQACNPF